MRKLYLFAIALNSIGVSPLIANTQFKYLSINDEIDFQKYDFGSDNSLKLSRESKKSNILIWEELIEDDSVKKKQNKMGIRLF